jgi:hypothetical protein
MDFEVVNGIQEKISAEIERLAGKE